MLWPIHCVHLQKSFLRVHNFWKLKGNTKTFNADKTGKILDSRKLVTLSLTFV